MFGISKKHLDSIHLMPVLFVLAVISLLSFVLLLLFSFNITHANSTSIDSDFEVTISEVLAFKLENCDNSNSSVVSIDITPTKEGVFKSNCQTTTINTNAPGYSLTVKATGSDPNYQNGATTNSLLYLNPIDINNFTNGLPTISSTTHIMANPSTLTNNTWGFAVEGLNPTDAPSNTLNTTSPSTAPNFDSTYTLDNKNNNYSELPTTDTAIYKTDQHPLPETEHTFYYGANVTTATTAGTYGTTITYTVVGQPVTPAPKTCKNAGTYPECIEFTVDVGDTGVYSIPTSGFVTGESNHTYDWSVYVDGYLTDSCTNGNCVGASSISGTNADGISLSGLTDGRHQILIIPNDEAIPGWGNAFGYFADSAVGANVSANRLKIISIDSQLTTMAFSPKTTESTTNASYMFAIMFHGCSNLTTSIRIIDTYKLPDTITDLSYFLYRAHTWNSVKEPIDLSGLSSWLIANNTITNLSNFLQSAHSRNAYLTSAVDLSPLSGWFNSNTSITHLDFFFTQTHYGNYVLNSSIDLTPLSNWFTPNRSVTSGAAFMYGTHGENTSLVLNGQVILPNWLKTMTNINSTPIWNTCINVEGADFCSLHEAFYIYGTLSGDSGEVRFEDGTVLSSIGIPRAGNLRTYENRTGITPINTGWK